MSVAALNVRIGGDIRELNKALKDAEKAVRGASTRIGEAARELSTKLSLPLIGFGVVAIKAAGEIEALQKAMDATFQGAGRSLAEASAEVENLRKSAEAPGLEFEQAVRGSIRLQNVGFSAEKARGVIEQLANTIATTGGTAEDLGEVVNQFSQMIGKGKLFQDDLKIITGRMPVVAQLMKEAFGTTTAEGINALGVDAREFVDTITKKMEGMPRVAGGISNAIVNAGTAIKMFLASVGESLNKTFNISAKLEGFATWLGDLSDRFSKLDDGTKKLIAGVGVFAIALGPMLKVGQGVVVVVGAMIKAYGVLQVTLLKSLAGEAIPSAIKAFQALNLATKLTILGAAIGIVLAAAAAFTLLAEDTSAAAKAQKSLLEVNRKAADSIAGQKSEVEVLVSAYKKESTTLEEKRRILEKLNKISPEYYGGIRAGKNDIEAITAATTRYGEELLRVAKITAAKERLVEIQKEMNNLNETADPTVWQQLKSSILSTASPAAAALSTATSFTENLLEQKAALEAEQKALIGVAQADVLNTKTTKELTGATGGLSDAKNKAKEASDAETAALELYQKQIEGAEAAVIAYNQTLLDAMKKEDEARAASMGATDTSGGPSGGERPLAVGKEKTEQQDREEAQIERLRQMKEQLEALPTAAETAAGAIASFGENVASSLEQSGASWKSFASAAVSAIAQVINQLIKMTVAKAIASAIEKGSVINPLVGIALAGVAGTLAGALFKKLVGAASFAKGTMNAPGGLSLVGEEGPELINLPARSQVYTASQTKNMLNGGSGNVSLSGAFTVKGTDLVLVLDRAQQKQTRTR